MAYKVTFTGPDGQDVTVTGPAAEVLANDAASNRIDFDADVEELDDAPVKEPRKVAPTKSTKPSEPVTKGD